MGVFEFVIAIIFMSFVFKVIKLRYESQGNNRTNGEANSLGVNSAMERKEQPSEGASQKSAGASLPWRFLFFAACCLIPMAFFFLATFAGRQVAIEPVPAMPEMAEDQWLPEGPWLEGPLLAEGPAPVAVPVPINVNSATRLAQPEEAPDDFIADVYPSIVDCAAPLAIKVYNEISDRLPTVPSHEPEDSSDEKDEDNQNKIAEKDTPEPTAFYIFNNDLSKQDYIPFVVAFRKKIQAKIKNSSVRDVTGHARNSLKPPKSHYRIYVSGTPKEINGEKVYAVGRVVCKVNGKDLSTELITNYFEKLWLSDFPVFSAKNPSKHYVVANSDGFFPSRSQALEQALRNCEFDSWTTGIRGSNGTLDGRRYLEVDKLIQKYERPYGDVFRCSVLLVAMASVPPTVISSPKLLPSIFNCGWKPSFEWSIALLIGLTVVIGTISNALTQGYYRTEISSLAIVMVALGVCLLIAIIFWNIGYPTLG